MCRRNDAESKDGLPTGEGRRVMTSQRIKNRLLDDDATTHSARADLSVLRFARLHCELFAVRTTMTKLCCCGTRVGKPAAPYYVAV